MALAVGSVARATHVVMPAPATGTHAPVRDVVGFGATDADSCTKSCHQAIGEEWRGSLHRHAWDDPIFEKAYAIEPVAFCRGCHAPDGNPNDVLPSLRAQAAGVSCATCHVDSGRVQGTHAPPARTAGDASSPHAFRLAPALATEAACSACHQFDFPKEARQLARSPMQDTVAEWRASSFASTPCQECHMPLVGEGATRHRRHDFRVMGDVSLLKEAIVATANRRDDTTLELTVASGRVGHAFPTGDMFRRLEARATAIDDAGNVVGTAKPIELARVFRDVPRDPDSKTDLSHQRVEVADTRLGPPGTKNAQRTVRLTVREAKGARLRWEIAYQRMMHPLAESFGVNQLEDETIVASGIVAP
jgi:hypothetical protein